MSDDYILAIDQGTTSSRAIVFNRKGKAISVSQREFKQHYPKPGWVEHDPVDIWSSQSAVTAETLSKAGLSPRKIKGIGITNQRETTVVWDKDTGKPVYNAIVWQDRRTAEYCRKLEKKGHTDLVSSKTGLRLDPYFSATKIRWILDNVEGARKLAKKGRLLFGTIDTWLVWKFTEGKVHVTDVTNASRTLLMNLKTLDWDDDLLELFDIPRAMLPEIRSCSEVYGHVSGDILSGKVPLAGIAGDQQAALFGQACFEKGMAKNTYGTGCFLLMNTGSKPVKSKNNLLTTVGWKVGDEVTYALEGSVFIAGAVVQWLRDELKIVSSAEECSRLATTVEDTGGLYLVPAFSGLGAPHWDPDARGLAIGITRGTNRAHFCRAALEGIAYQSLDLIKCMEKDSKLTLKELRVDGGASRSEFLMQFQADLVQTNVVRPECIETTALGAAYLAGLATGYWQGVDDIRENWKKDVVFSPLMKEKETRKRVKCWNQAVEKAKGGVE